MIVQLKRAAPTGRARTPPSRRRRRRASHGDQLQRARRRVQAHQLEGPRHLARGAQDPGAARHPHRRSRSAGFFGINQGQIEELEQGQTKETKLKDEYVSKKKQAINLDLHRQQLREIDTQFGALLKQLPNKSQMDALLVDINQAGLGRGLQFELFKPAAAGDTARVLRRAADHRSR